MFLKSQHKKLFEKISDIVGIRLEYMMTSNTKKWSATEIEKIYGLSKQRQSELRGRLQGKYLHLRISTNDFTLLLARRFMDLDQLLASQDLDDEEKMYLKETFGIQNDLELRDIVRQCEKAGVDYKTVLKNHLTKVLKPS
jgi:hypothetical protein